LLDLINGILDLSKIESGKKTVTPEEVYYKNVVSNVENMFRQMLIEKGLDYKIEVDKKLPETLYTDQQKLEQIIKNLMSNALKFTEKGSITIRFCKPESDVNLEMSGLDPEKAVAIAISDTGRGIPKEKHLEIFEAFQQADGTIVRKYGGTGLGLTICRELAKLLGGEIQLESYEDKGSVFTFYIAENLPELINEKQQNGAVPNMTEGKSHYNNNETFTYLEDENSEYTIAQTPMSIQDDRKRIDKDDKVIMIIEDDVNFAKILFDYCHEKGFKCIHAVDGETGLDFSEKITVSAIILDLKLPGISGWGVLKKLKSNIKTRHIPVHIMSVEDRPDNILQKGVIGYLNKPVTNNDLNEAFAKINKLVSNGVKKLLIVGDDPGTTEKLSETFGSMGVEIESLKEGLTAYNRIKEEKFDCLIMDLELSDISGFELLKKFDSLDSSALPPIIIHTGRELGDDEFFELNKYATSMITKSELSTERLIDEVALFLHSIVHKLPGSILKNISSMSDDSAILKGKKIMIVDDDVRNIYSIITTLEDYGLEFIKAANGKKALEGLKQNEDIDLILMDIMMPEMDGYEAIRRIRKMPEYENLPVIALTAKGMEKDRQQSFEAGATDYLMKPVDSDKLLSTIRVWLHN
jgi:tubulin-specific chaperone A